MQRIALQISPEVKSAYFADYLDVAEQELKKVFGDLSVIHRKIGTLEFLEIEENQIPLTKVTRLSFVQGIYKVEGELLRPLDLDAGFRLHEDFVFGSKYKGKTNERLTQMLINVGLASIGADDGAGLSILDPMCGRGTTLLWGLQYGFKARGIEQDRKALPDIQRNFKKWAKLRRQKHKMSEGFILGEKRKSLGKFIDFNVEGNSMRIVNGDSRNADQIFRKEKFDLIICDLPYGVQHFTTAKTRNPLDVIKQSVTAWASCLKKRGCVVLAFNNYNPKREALIEPFVNAGFVVDTYSAPHRMSESIVRDVVVFKCRDDL